MPDTDDKFDPRTRPLETEASFEIEKPMEVVKFEIIQPEGLLKVETKYGTFSGWKVDDDLDVSNGSMSCNSAGFWTVEAWLDHQSFWCSKYRLGIEFGTRIDDKWVSLTHVYYGTAREHCNGARLHHSNSGGPEELIRSNFGAITHGLPWTWRLNG